MKKYNVDQDKCDSFALRMVKLYQFLVYDKKEICVI